MPDKTTDIKDLGYTAEDVVKGLKKIVEPDYDNKEVENEGPIVTDRFISFNDTDHDNPYDDPEILKIEDIFGFMMAYRKPYSDDSRKSLKNYRNRLTKYCRLCSRLPSSCQTLWKDTCRVLYLKTAMTREIKGTEICVRPMKGIRVQVIK